MWQLGALSGQDNILNSNTAQRSLLCNVTTCAAVLAIYSSQQLVFPMPVFQNFFCNQLYVQGVRGGMYIRLNHIDITKNMYIPS